MAGHINMRSELLDLLIYGFIFNGDGISPDTISLIHLYYNNNIKYTHIFIIKGSHKGGNPLLNKIECINLNYKISYNINIYNIDDFNDDRNGINNDINDIQLSTIDRNWDTEENGYV